jgi:glutamyl-tRNA synthetase
LLWIGKIQKQGETTQAFKERGFLSEAFVNMLAMLGWNDGSGQEIFTLEELIEKFSMSRVHKGGAKFDFEKAKWFNHEWIKHYPANQLLPLVKPMLNTKNTSDDYISKVIILVKERCILLSDFQAQSAFFFEAPEVLDIAAVKPKWNDAKQLFFIELIRQYQLMTAWTQTDLENEFKEIAAANEIKPGDVLLPFRVMLVGGKFGPGVFDIAALIGKEETLKRIKYALDQIAI